MMKIAFAIQKWQHDQYRQHKSASIDFFLCWPSSDPANTGFLIFRSNGMIPKRSVRYLIQANDGHIHLKNIL